MKYFSFLFLMYLPGIALTQECQCDSLRDFQALLLLSSALNNHPWDTTQPLRQWDGITINNEGCVEALEVRSRLIEGIIPIGTLGNLSCIKTIYLNENKISGPIPPDLGNLAYLEYLDLSYNQLSTAIPKEIGNITTLKSLRLNYNFLSGSLPVELGNLTLLFELLVENNELSGTIPASFENLKKLSALSLAENDFSGEIPKFFQELELLSFRINDNRFRDTAWINFFSFMGTVVDISNNEFNYLTDITFTTIRQDKFKIFGNRFTFDDILPNIQLFSGIFIGSVESERYSPQKIFSDDTVLVFNNTSPPIIDLGIDEDINGNTYQWYKDDQEIQETNSSAINLNALFSNSESYAGVYYCKVTNSFVPDLELTSGRIEVQVDIPNPSSSTTPAAFTPNSDGVNDFFIIPAMQGGQYLDNELIIYNRVRKIVYRQANYNNQWDGTDMNFRPLPPGTYYYVFKSGDFQESGLITLVRAL